MQGDPSHEELRHFELSLSEMNCACRTLISTSGDVKPLQTHMSPCVGSTVSPGSRCLSGPVQCTYIPVKKFPK